MQSATLTVISFQVANGKVNASLKDNSGVELLLAGKEETMSLRERRAGARVTVTHLSGDESDHCIIGSGGARTCLSVRKE